MNYTTKEMYSMVLKEYARFRWCRSSRSCC